MGFLMAIVMGIIMSFVVTAINLGFEQDFFRNWMLAFFGAMPIGFPVALIVTPTIKAIVDRYTE